MMVSVAKNKSELKKRMIRFFNSNKKPRSSLREFLDDITLHVDTYVFGGAIRDIAINGVKDFYSDIDVVFEYRGENSDIELLLKNYSYEKNKFGGYRLDIDGWELDLWEARNTWAFKSKHLKYKSISSILESTITNWDQVLFDWNEQKLLMKDHYLDDLKNGYLDLVLEKNPNPLGQSVKILHYYINKNAHLISKEMSLKIIQILNSHSHDQLKKYEIKSYKKNYISKEIYDFLKNSSNLNKPDLLPSRLDSFNKTYDLI